MTAREWKRVCGVFESAVSLPRERRAAFVDEQTAEEPELRDVVRRMIEAEEESAGYLETPALNFASARLGAWRTLREIGRGGMGIVFLGERADGLYERRVAIKIAPGGVHSETALLARLEHPSIARLLDAGETAEGFPYLVMEYVDGAPVDEWIRKEQPPERRRLEVFREICAAVQYAHQRLVLHRDLKPSNILITAGGRPKLLDFGIARALDSAATATRFPAVTPEYASPEQLLGERLTTAADVYTLGLLLHTMLAGAPLRDFRGLSFREIIEEALRPEPGPVSVGGDLGQVIRKAIRPEPHRRYGSAAELAEEVRRYGQGLPVLAKEPTLGYRARRFILRHKVKIAMGTTVAVALAATTAAALWQARIADRRFQQVRELASSVLYEIHDGVANLPGSNPARLLLAGRALKYLEALSGEARSDAAVWADVASGYVRLGDVQGGSALRNLGLYEQAEASYTRAKEIADRLLESNPRDPDVRKLHLRAERPVILAALRGAGRKEALVAVEKHLQRAVEFERDAKGDPETARFVAEAYFLKASGLLYNARHEETLAAWLRTLELFEALPAATYPEKRKVAGVHQYLCDAYLREKDLKNARRHIERAVALQEDALRRHPDLITARMDLSLCHYQAATVLAAEGNHAEAVAALDRMIPIRERLVEEEPTDVVGRAWLAGAHAHRGQYLEALRRLPEAATALEAGLRQFLELLEVEKSSERYQVAVAETEAQLAEVYDKLARHGRACDLYRRASRRLAPLTVQARRASRNPATTERVALAAERCANAE